MAFSDAQRAFVEARAAQNGSWLGLVYFLHVRRDLDGIRGLKSRITAPRDVLAARLALGEPPSDSRELARRAAASDDLWIAMLACRHLLNASRPNDALALAMDRLQREVYDVSLLNYAGRQLLTTDEDAMGRKVLERSLELNPFQEDIRGLAEQGQAKAGAAAVEGGLSAYIPACNVEEYMGSAIESILAQHHPVEELIVVDDGCTDDSMAIARAYPVRIVSHGENRGLAAARNTALRAISSPLVASIDTDAMAEPTYLRNALIELSAAPPETAGVGGMLIEQFTDTAPDAWRARHMPQHWGSARQYPVPVLFGSNAIFRRETLLGVGGYDEYFRSNAEDVNMCARLRAAGCKLAYTPAAKAFHQRRDTVESLLRTRWNYEFAYRAQDGYFSDIGALSARLADLLDATLVMLKKDLEDGFSEFVGIDLLAFFHDAFQGARYCVDQGRIGHAEGCRLQRCLLGLARDSLGAARLPARFEEYLAPLTLSWDGSEEPSPGPPVLETALAGIGCRLEKL